MKRLNSRNSLDILPKTAMWLLQLTVSFLVLQTPLGAQCLRAMIICMPKVGKGTLQASACTRQVTCPFVQLACCNPGASTRATLVDATLTLRFALGCTDQVLEASERVGRCARGRVSRRQLGLFSQTRCGKHRCTPGSAPAAGRRCASLARPLLPVLQARQSLAP